MCLAETCIVRQQNLQQYNSISHLLEMGFDASIWHCILIAQELGEIMT